MNCTAQGSSVEPSGKPVKDGTINKGKIDQTNSQK
jgi:hypothetical protein